MVRDSSNSSLQLVEMCSNEGVWSPVCDHDWTLEDATVICTELGYNNSGDCCPDITIQYYYILILYGLCLQYSFPLCWQGSLL